MQAQQLHELACGVAAVGLALRRLGEVGQQLRNVKEEQGNADTDGNSMSAGPKMRMKAAEQISTGSFMLRGCFWGAEVFTPYLLLDKESVAASGNAS